ncbi:hypothetical protein HZ989_00895 [Brevundimonas sp. AJA228-03]|uniref:hypothetical protein n=1 Tax=Brevundimonas sp. AJA228-03 TaxID=2752515 RepID=UPI001ADF66D6|nr:hypothetical protein [Brevundimonas sp. AJA228-03]QTN19674.1 hypothetical protein HZ989_00895 [Brevundimonas sp. AJA228-03]
MTTVTLAFAGPSRSDPTLAVAAGRNLVAAGTLFGLANLFQWSVMSGALHLHPAMLSLSWPLAVTLFIVILRRLRSSGGPAAVRAAGWSRGAILLQIGAALSLAALSAALHDWSLMMWMSPIGLGVYAIAWLVASMRGGAAWMGTLGVTTAAAAGGVAVLVGTPTQYLAYACGLIAFTLIPGLVLALGRAR